MYAVFEYWQEAPVCGHFLCLCLPHLALGLKALVIVLRVILPDKYGGTGF